MSAPQFSIVVPLFNEEKVFGILISRLNKLLEQLPYAVEVVMVDDGSSDATKKLMEQVSKTDSRYYSIFLTRNFGHQIAITAGLQFANATDGIMIIDGDLQDPPELFLEFYNKLKEGYDVVYAVRKKRKENFIKRVLYKTFYRLQKKFVNIDIPLDSGDFLPDEPPSGRLNYKNARA